MVRGIFPSGPKYLITGITRQRYCQPKILALTFVAFRVMNEPREAKLGDSCHT